MPMLKAYAFYAQGKAEKNIAEYNAEVAENQAIREEQAARYEAEKQAAAGSRLKGTQRAQYAKAGVTGAGSPLLVLEDTANLIQQDIQMTLWGGKQRAGYYRSQASLFRTKGKYAYKTGLLRAGVSLVDDATKAAMAAAAAG